MHSCTLYLCVFVHINSLEVFKYADLQFHSKQSGLCLNGADWFFFLVLRGTVVGLKTSIITVTVIM